MKTSHRIHFGSLTQKNTGIYLRLHSRNSKDECASWFQLLLEE